MKHTALANLYLWQGISLEAQEACSRELQSPKTFEKGTVIYSQRDFPRAFAVVLEGKAAVLSPSGATLRTLAAGDICGVTALFGCDRYATTITALSRIKLQFITEEQLAGWMERHPQIGMNHIRFLNRRILYLNDKIRLYTEGSVEERLLSYISAHTAADGEILVSGGMAGLARELNIGRTSLYRTLEQLENCGKIFKNGTKWYREEKK